MYRLQNGQVVTISLISLIFAFFFKSVYWGFRVAVVFASVLAVWNSHVAILQTIEKGRDAYLAVYSWLFDERVDLGTLLKKLNKKPDAIKNFRLHHKAIFKLPLSRKILLATVNEKQEMMTDCTKATQDIIESI